MTHIRNALCIAAMLLAAPALAATQGHGARIGFSATAERRVVNDLGSATAYVEMAGADSADLAQRVNAVMAQALATAKAEEKVTVKSGGSNTWPVYASKPKAGQTATIEGWRMRSELQLESRDAAALGALLGRLQTTLAVSHIGFSPSAETRRKAEDDAALDAIRVFREKAARYAAALKRPYRLRKLNISGGGVPMPRMRAMATAAEAAPMPLEAGESTVQMTVEGEIELIEGK